MYTKTAFISALAGFAGLAIAAPAPVARATNENVFAAIATRSGTPEVHLRAINANGGRFFLGKDSSGYCPNVTTVDCSGFQTTTTVFAYNPTSKTMSLDVTVPGGQQIYVAPTGELGYTVAHSATYPAGSALAPFNYTPQAGEGRVGSLNFENGGFYACPVEGLETVYQVFAAAYGDQAKYQSECIGFGFSTSEWDGKTAWQY